MTIALAFLMSQRFVAFFAAFCRHCSVGSEGFGSRHTDLAFNESFLRIKPSDWPFESVVDDLESRAISQGVIHSYRKRTNRK